MKKSIENTKFWNILAKSQEVFMVICDMMAVSIVVINVILRQVFRINFIGYDELIIIAVLWLYFIGGSYATLGEHHITADVFGNLIKKPHAKSVYKALVSFIETCLLGYLVYLCIPYFSWNMAMKPITPGLKIPLLVSQLAIIVGFSFSFFYTSYYFIRDVNIMISTFKGGAA